MNYISYKDAELPVIVNYSALKQFQNKTKKSLSEVEEVINDLELFEQLFYYALQAGHKMEGRICNITKDMCEDILSFDDNYSQFITIFSNDVLKLFKPKQTTSNEVVEEVKKN
jgi:hypothetical protein